jgi:hypothetical protein
MMMNDEDNSNNNKPLNFECLVCHQEPEWQKEDDPTEGSVPFKYGKVILPIKVGVFKGTNKEDIDIEDDSQLIDNLFVLCSENCVKIAKKRIEQKKDF